MYQAYLCCRLCIRCQHCCCQHCYNGAVISDIAYIANLAYGTHGAGNVYDADIAYLTCGADVTYIFSITYGDNVAYIADPADPADAKPKNLLKFVHLSYLRHWWRRRQR